MRRDNPPRGLFTPGVIVGSLVLGGGLFLMTILFLKLSRPPRIPVGVATAALTIIPAPTVTRPPPTPTPEILAPDSGALPSPPPGEIAIGTFVQVSGTEGDGLRLRVSPGLDFEPRFLGLEDEVFKIEDGPREVDGYVWWYLVAPFDPTRNGWAVSNYLEAIQNP